VPYRNIDDPVKLRRLLESVLLLEADLELPVLLHHFVEEACSMTAARYGALGVLDASGTKLAEFITVGVDPETEEAIGARPTGKGVLGLLITDPKPLRLTDLSRHPDSYGFPPHHPHMTSFLGVPVTARDEVYGNLYLTDKIGWSEFTQDDEELVRGLAQAAGIAIENARLHERVQQVAVYEERDRIARDLHDAVIQRLFAIGLSLQGLVRAAPTSEAADRVTKAIADVDDTIRQIRSSIFELSTSDDDQGARATIRALADELRAVLGFEAEVSFDGPVDTVVSGELLDHLLAALREALTNVARHAEATEVAVVIAADGDHCSLLVADNGRGLGAPGSVGGGLGLVNLRRRAEKLGGELHLESSDTGTRLRWWVPVAAG
jgi:signal transduction histidine kinase